MFKRSFYIVLSAIFILQSLLIDLPIAHADTILDLPTPGSMVNLSPVYMPVVIKGVRIHPDNPLLFDFIVDTGNSGLKINGLEFKTESQKLIKYFLAALTIKEDDLWVNLSPYEKDRIIPQELGKTEMGRDMLAQDYILKQLTASLIYPERSLGKKFWDDIYTKARQMYGATNIPVNTFNKVWIVADKARILQRNNTAYVVGAHLKVMLEEDYLALQKHADVSPSLNTHSVASQVIRAIIIPEIEKEVNQGRNFALLRQMYYSMILATWYKLTLKNALLNQVYSNKSKTSGILSDDPTIKEKIYQQYLKAYKKGVFNYIKEDIDETSQQTVPRKYFSGGLKIEIDEALQVENKPSPNDDPMTSGDEALVTTIAGPSEAADAALLTLAQENTRAFETDNVEDFIRLIHNEYLVNSQGRLEELSRHVRYLDPFFTFDIIKPDYMTSQWDKIMLLNKDNREYEADILSTRSVNSQDRGVPKGGFRAIFNFNYNKNQDEEPITMSDLMKDPAFRMAFGYFNDLLKKSNATPEAKKKYTKDFIQKWVEELSQALSMWMSFKTSLIGLPLGGAKGVIFEGQIRINDDGTASIEDTELWDDENKENIARIARHYVRLLYDAHAIGHDIDVPAPDKRTNPLFMGFAMDEYILLNLKVIKIRDQTLHDRLLRIYKSVRKGNNGIYPATSTALVEEANRYMHKTNNPVPELAAITGKELAHGGVAGRTEATGFGVESTDRSLFKALDIDFRGMTKAIHGAGNVALYEALQSVRDGIKVVALGDEGVSLFKDSGYTEQEILALIWRSENDKKNGKLYQCWQEVFRSNLKEFRTEGETAAERQAAILEAHVDILSPSATEGVITEENASRINAKYIIPGANGPITPAALKILEEKDIIVVPDTLANAAGVMVSYFEQVQADTGDIFTAEEINEIREQLHSGAFAVVWAESRKLHVHLTEAADIVAAKGMIRAGYLALIKKYDGNLNEISNTRGHGETQAQLFKQIKASGLFAQLKAIKNNSLEIIVVNKDDQETLQKKLNEAGMVITGSSVRRIAPFSITRQMLAQAGPGKIIVDPIIDTQSVVDGEEPDLLATPVHPARLDGNGNLVFTVKNTPAAFRGVASKRLARATQLLTIELASGSLNNASGVRSGIVAANGRLINSSSPLTDDEFGRILELPNNEKRTIGIPTELTKGETRVGATPAEVEQLVKQGFTVFVERGAGARSNMPDSLFIKAGARMATAKEVWSAGVIRKVRAPLKAEFQYFTEGKIIEALLFLNSPDSNDLKHALVADRVTAIAYEKVRKKGYRPLLDRVFYLEGVGADEDEREHYILDPMARVAGSVSSFWAALYYLKSGKYSDLVDDSGDLLSSVVKSIDKLLEGFIRLIFKGFIR